MANTAIYRTLAESGSGTVCTLSVWFKKTFVGVEKALWGGWRSSTTRFQIRFKDDDTMDVEYGYSSSWYSLITDRVFRDTGAWMHVVLAVDSTQATPADREKLYINGVQETSFSTENYMPQNYDTLMTASGDEVMIGCSNASGSAGSHQSFWKGNMSWAQFVDGAQLAPTEFGEVDATSGIWKIKTDVYGTPGTTGFCLKMEDRTNLDLDSSSNAFTFSTEGTLTPTYDNPSNNFCTLNAIASDLAGGSLTLGNNYVQFASDSTYRSIYGTLGNSTGKYYFEGYVQDDGNATNIGIIDTEQNTGSNQDYTAQSRGYSYNEDGQKYNNGSGSSYGDTYASTDIIGCALDLTNGAIWFSKNGTWQNSATIAEIGAGTTTNAAFTGLTLGASYLYGPAISGKTNAKWKMNFGNGYFADTAISSEGTNASGIGSFEYDVPTGFTAWSTKGFNE